MYRRVARTGHNRQWTPLHLEIGHPGEVHDRLSSDNILINLSLGLYKTTAMPQPIAKEHALEHAGASHACCQRNLTSSVPHERLRRHRPGIELVIHRRAQRVECQLVENRGRMEFRIAICQVLSQKNLTI